MGKVKRHKLSVDQLKARANDAFLAMIEIRVDYGYDALETQRAIEKWLEIDDQYRKARDSRSQIS